MEEFFNLLKADAKNNSQSRGTYMEDLINDIKPFIILFIVLLVIFMCLAVAVKILTMMELYSEKKAYDLISQEEELEIRNKQLREDRDRELHRANLELIRKQEAQAEAEIRQAEAEIRQANRIDRQNVNTNTVTKWSRQFYLLYF